jgi:hypothetical protein
MAVPLLFLYVYSSLVEPLYLVGRYDITALPPYLLLAALGFERLVLLVPPRRRLPAFVALLVGLGGLATHAYRSAVFHPALASDGGANTMRGEILQKYLSPEDAIVCTGMMFTPTRYQMMRRGLDAPIVTFPRSQMHHVGWFHAPDVVRLEETTARGDARDIVDWIAADPPRHRLLWCLVPVTVHDREDFTRILDWLLAEVRARGCRTVTPPGEEQRWQELGIYPIGPGGSPTLNPR